MEALVAAAETGTLTLSTLALQLADRKSVV